MRFQQRLFKGHLDEGEMLFFVAHKHWMEILEDLTVFIIFGLLLPWGIWIFLDVKIWIILLWHFAFACWFCYKAFDWYFDALLVTNRSVIDIAWYSFFDKESARVDYGDLKEMSYEIKGFWPTVLQYGNIFIHLNSGGNIALTNVRNPKKVELTIKKYKDEFLKDQKMTDSAAIQEILSDIVKNHIAEHGLPRSRKKLGKKDF